MLNDVNLFFHFARGVDGILGEGHFDARGHFDAHGVVVLVDAFHGAVDAADGDDLLAHAEAVASACFDG